jgi:hypothetical protein
MGPAARASRKDCTPKRYGIQDALLKSAVLGNGGRGAG